MKSVEEIIVTALPKLKSTARYLANNKSDVDDIVGNAILKILENKDKHKYTSDSSTIGWMRMILRNEFINDYRSFQTQRKGTPIIVEDVSDLESMTNITHTNLAIDRLAHESAGIWVKAKLEKDSIRSAEHNFRILSMLADGWKMHEIATEMEVPEGTIKSRLNRIRSVFKEPCLN